ncbi:hypothetical protein MVEN_00414800 [Mycena venus]|uniref:Ras GEF n=1 Tax=Mycena venus TaxID=2733690 RepID=A0A8H6YX22_9AGAR|nr:hypothetical protein MVEN_00414800 [Mycena venus]
MSAPNPPTPPSPLAVFCRALYNYEAQDPSCLSFHQNDILELLTQEPTGWWDGLLGDKRGWFPSNHVVVLSDEEAELALSELPLPHRQTGTDFGGLRGVEGTPDAVYSPEIGDFWIPEVAPDGRIHYVNMKTGQRAEDLPNESDRAMEVALGRQGQPEESFAGSLTSYQSNENGALNNESYPSINDMILSPESPSLEADYMDADLPMYEEVASKAQSQSVNVRSKRNCTLPGDVPIEPVFLLQRTCDPTEITLDPDGAVRAGTVPALVERLTTHERADHTFIKTFLMTFKTFTTVEELFDLLVARFWIQPPPRMTEAEREEWVKLKQHVIQTRVLNILKSMVVDDDVLEKDEMFILDRMKEFITTEGVARSPAAKQLSTLIQRARQGVSTIKMITSPQGMPPPPIVPKSSKKLKLLDIDPLELARQLTIMESRLYQRIRPLDCLQRVWEQKTNNIDNIAVFLQTNDKIPLWVAESIIEKDDLRRRAGIIEYLISVADHCRTLQNFSAMAAIISGLNKSPVRRLHQTWAHVSPRSMAQFNTCEILMSSDRGLFSYRSLMKSAVPPCVPLLGISLSTLQFILEGYPDNLPAQGAQDSPANTLVNFQKRQKASEVIHEIKRWQQVPFNLHVIPSVQAYIEDSLNYLSDTPEFSERLEVISLDLEPMELEQEKMSRLLRESGFL